MSIFDNTPQSSAQGAVGGIAPSSYNTGERKMFHYIENIFDPDKHPADHLHKYVVPQENELVFDVNGGIIYRVAKVDWQATLKSTLVPWGFQNTVENNTTEQDWIFGVRGGPLLGEALLAVDFSIRPSVARVDATIMRPGAAYAKLFKGNDLSANGKVISAQYDQSNNMLNNHVPVRLAEIVDRTNQNIMTTGPFSVTENAESLKDGTRCTLVFYDEGGNFIPPVQPVMVQHSAYMRDHQIGTKYVTDIELVSPWFTNTMDPDRMIIPINVNLLSVEFRAIVHYSDGSINTVHAVNGGKFSLYGLNEYRPKYPGQVAEVTLVYKLDEDEQHYLADPGNPHFKSRTYTLEAGMVKGAYSPKLYTYPQWDPAIAGYRLMHLLYDLERRTLIDVSDKVTLADSSPAYRPSSYGVVQNLIFKLNLRDVAPTYQSVTFTQHTEILLVSDVNGPGKRWEVAYTQGRPPYASLFANARNNGAATWVNLANGCANLTEWLDKLYWAVDPSYDPWDEEKAPTPTHFDLMHEDGRRWQFPISRWNQNNNLPIELGKGKTWFINWINKTGSNELQLATTGVIVNLV